MINEEVLSEKLKYLIIMNAKPKLFEVISVYIEFEYIDQNHTKLENYDVDVKFDYNGELDFDMYSFVHDIQRMSEKLKDILNEYVITEDGKIVEGKNSNCFTTYPLIFRIDYKADETHIFDLGYKFTYTRD
jgi:hypothetical protein